MKKNLFIIAMLTLASCQKETIKNSAVLSETSTTTSDKIIFSSTQTVPYDSRLFNSCSGEWVHLIGKVTYNLKESFSNHLYIIVYEINFQGVKGIGETSGAQYSGGGAIAGKVTASFEYYTVEGTNIYKVRFNTSGGHALIFVQNAHYVMNANGVIAVEFNDYSDGCK